MDREESSEIRVWVEMAWKAIWRQEYLLEHGLDWLWNIQLESTGTSEIRGQA